ncbi:glucosamine kinase [Mycolicibacterium rhodesiae]|uniref:Glucosamine kinase n=1 Tax=Mycolicibacterium rhodesiae TaxID=36814 RepID=A0A1X0J1N8_MYCRH|nr:glucosamine kinase [Mycolicibacterium rhodesiae]MCV7344804.1 aminoglycoside phosphotransferase [Mycolicibacterium rhodesiae]ORB55736.1 aminoglycoside phosphotransferase [Mycolicibacterium rhodesiae]
MGGELDSLDLAVGKRLSVVATANGLTADPQVRNPDGSWRRARPGDGVAEALVALLSTAPEVSEIGSFTLHAWAARVATGERAITVDQTNESVIVGDAAVVKWAAHLQAGPHPAPSRIETLRTNGFRHMPCPWGLITWRSRDGAETLVAGVDEYLPGAVDGWTWAVDLIATAAAGPGAPAHDLASAAADVGTVIAELHAALAVTATVASPADAQRWRTAAAATLDDARAHADPVMRDLLQSRAINEILDGLGGMAGTPLIEGHGDLHVGQVLRHPGGYAVIDFDGNPVLPPAERILPIPAVLDVAGFAQSLTHAAIVARRHHRVDEQALSRVERLARDQFTSSYTTHLAALGHGGLYDPACLRAFRLQQVLREVVYAARHLPRWMYVPEAALSMLLDEGITGGR